jgi:transcriptional regulator with XRE-family HTH domain
MFLLVTTPRPCEHDHIRANGATVRALRQARGLRQDELATRAAISTGYLSRIETGKRRAEAAKTEAIAAALDVAPEVLTGQRPAIEILRESLGITLDTLAHDTGLDVDRLARIERGAELLPAGLQAVVANRLGVAPTALQPNVHRHALADAS